MPRSGRPRGSGARRSRPARARRRPSRCGGREPRRLPRVATRAERSSSVARRACPAVNTNPFASGASTVSSRDRPRPRSRGRANRGRGPRGPAGSRSRQGRAPALPARAGRPAAEPQPPSERSSPSVNRTGAAAVPSPSASSGDRTTVRSRPAERVGQRLGLVVRLTRAPERARASVTTTHEPSGSSSAGVGIVSNRNGAALGALREGAVGEALRAGRRTGRRPPAAAARGALAERRRRGSARARAQRRARDPVGGQLRGRHELAERFDLVAPGTPAGPGARASPGKTSTTPPRTANSPRRSTTSARAYPSSTRRSARASGASLAARASSSGAAVPERGDRCPASRRAPAPPARTDLGRAAARRRRPGAPRPPAHGEMPSYGSASHAGSSDGPARDERDQVRGQRLGLARPRGDRHDGELQRGRERPRAPGPRPPRRAPRSGARASSSSRSNGSDATSAPPRFAQTHLILPDNAEQPRPRNAAGHRGQSYRARVPLRPRAGRPAAFLRPRRPRSRRTSRSGLAHARATGSKSGSGQRLADVVALRLVAAEVGEPVEGRAVLDALGHHAQPQVLAEVDRGAHDHEVVRVAVHVHHERPVDLDLVDLQPLEVTSDE